MNKLIAYRIIADVLLLVSILHGWWVLALLVAVLSFWFFSYYFEFLLGALLFDSLFGMVGDYGIKGYIASLLSLLLVIVLTIFKNIVRK